MATSETKENGAKPAEPTEATVEPSFCAPFGPNVHVSTHPVLKHKISILRSSSTTPASFRTVLRDITFHLGYEATTTLTTRSVALTVPVGHDHIECTGRTLNEKVALIPILRSGLGMIDPMLELVPSAGVHHIGMYRQNLMPVQYYNRLPRKCESDIAYVVDPLIATAQTLTSVVSMLKKWGVKKIHVISVIASKPGLEEFLKTHPDVFVTVGHVDDELRDDGTIIPGLGDAGDRLFGTPMIDDDEALLHPSKRKRSDA